MDIIEFFFRELVGTFLAFLGRRFLRLFGYEPRELASQIVGMLLGVVIFIALVFLAKFLWGR